MSVDNPWFESYRNEIYPTELTLNKANTSDSKTQFLDLNIKIKDFIKDKVFMINGRILTSKLLIFLG